MQALKVTVFIPGLFNWHITAEHALDRQDCGLSLKLKVNSKFSLFQYMITLLYKGKGTFRLRQTEMYNTLPRRPGVYVLMLVSANHCIR